MFLNFFYLLREHGLPVSLKEYLTLLEALRAGVGVYNVDDFYYLCRSVLVKHEKFLDKFDQLYGAYFRGMEIIPPDIFQQVPEDWLRQEYQRFFTEEEKAMIEAMGGLDKLMERLKQLFEEQKERHEGGNTWIGTLGTSPFGANGYNPEGFRIGQESSRNRRAVKVWDKRAFRNLDENVELNTRSFKMALRQLRVLTREGVQDELDIDGTIDRTGKNAGILDIQMRPERRNRVKVLMLMDVGGSMDDHIRTCEELFSAAKHQFKHLEFYYFHNFIYEYVWRDNNRRWSDRIPTFELLHKYNRDYKVIFVGDAAMGPYEILYKGGSVEHNNAEAGSVWMQRFTDQYPNLVWLNPNREANWHFFESTQLVRKLVQQRMFPLTVPGITDAMKLLKKTQGQQPVRSL